MECTDCRLPIIEPALGDMPSLPVHPDACATCGGFDWDKMTDAPCPDESWCQAFQKNGDLWAVCSRPAKHQGLHATGTIEWDNPPRESVCCDCFYEKLDSTYKRQRSRPIVKPAAIFLRDKKLLVVRTKGNPLFYAVGGKLDLGESDVECLHRETKEEIGCQVTYQKYYQTFVGPSSDNKKTVVMICFFVELDREPTPSSEIEELLWADSQTPKEVIGSLLRDYIIPSLHKDGLVM